jgi:hypothetical protein
MQLSGQYARGSGAVGRYRRSGSLRRRFKQPQDDYDRNIRVGSHSSRNRRYNVTHAELVRKLGEEQGVVARVVLANACVNGPKAIAADVSALRQTGSR